VEESIVNSEDLIKEVESPRVLIAILHSVLPASASARLDDDTNLFALGLDSLKAVEFLLAIEDVYGITFDLSEVNMDSFKCLRAVKSLVTNKIPPLRSPAQP
jgi:acyl carrier protein